MNRSTQWSILSPLLLALLLPILAACGGSPRAAAPATLTVPAAPTAMADTGAAGGQGQNQVTIDNFSFSPATLTVVAGTTVAWTNHDDVPHTVTAADKSYSSGAIDTDDTFSHQFTTPGTYAYFCSLHPTMTARIIVK